MSQCAAVSTYGVDGQEWTYHCTLDEGHCVSEPLLTPTGEATYTKDGQPVVIDTPTEHVYLLDDGQPPLPEPDAPAAPAGAEG